MEKVEEICIFEWRNGNNLIVVIFIYEKTTLFMNSRKKIRLLFVDKESINVTPCFTLYIVVFFLTPSPCHPIPLILRISCSWMGNNGSNTLLLGFYPIDSLLILSGFTSV